MKVYKLSLSPFWLVAFLTFWLILSPLCPAVVAIQIVAVPTFRWRSTNTSIIALFRRVASDQPWPIACSFNWQLARKLGFRDGFWVFFTYTKLLGRTEMRTRERKDRQRNEQFGISPETIEQELRLAVCEQQRDLRRMIVQIIAVNQPCQNCLYQSSSRTRNHTAGPWKKL